MEDNSDSRVSVHLRVDKEKYDILEDMRKVGFGLATTNRNRTDIYNQVIGNGIQVFYLQKELGDREFEKVWSALHKINWRKINIDKVLEMLK